MAEDWLINQWFPRCNILGYNYSFNATLYLSGIALDVDGDTGMVFTQDRNTGMPLIQLIPSHRIGHRYTGNTVEGGKYDGFTIWDGVIVNSSNIPVAYSILGDLPEDDMILPARSMQLLYEPEWQDQYRGISRLARSLFDILDIADTDELEKRAVKLAATIGLIHSTESGQPDEGAILVGVEEDALGNTPYPTRPPFEMLNSGEILYTKAGAGEDIKAFLSDRPSPNTEAFVARIERRIFSSLGYPYELSDPSKVGGASVRLIQDIARQSIASRQTTLERRAKLAVTYALTVAMDNDIIPRNDDDDWNNFKFTKPAKLTVDNGYEQQALREGFKLGITSFSSIAGQSGEDWYELRDQVQKETEDLLNRATMISKKYNITLDAALNLLSQRTPNAAPIVQNVQE